MALDDKVVAAITETLRRERPELTDKERERLARVILQAIRDAGYYIS